MRSTYFVFGLLLSLAACGPSSTPPDSGTPDSGTPDSGTPDSGTPDSGTPDSGTPDAGNPDGGGGDAGTPDAGCTCSGGVCLADGGCGQCARDEDCAAGALPACDTARNVCVRCHTAPDSCDAGSWCNAGNSCDPGCGRASDCASGLCDTSHECTSCRTDSECLSGRLCTSGTCHAPCSGTCGGGNTCCGMRCADVGDDPLYCGGCNAPCTGICAAGTCAPAQLSSVCALPRAVAVLDGRDDAAGIALAAALAGCSPSVPFSTVQQDDAGFINPVTGYPSRTGELLCIAGGSFFQRVIGHLERNGYAPVLDTSTSGVYRYSRRDGGVIVQGPEIQLSPTHDVFLVQLARTPEGAVVVNAAGFQAEGTRAAAWYFVNTMMPMRASLTNAWYVVDWVDLNVNGMPDGADTWTIVGQGVD